jgi:predicted anti-sigma-YlaC factor YlaD
MNFERISCKDVANHICESLGEDLNSPKCLAIKEHLEECPSCKEYFNSVKKTINLYQDYNVELPDDVHKRLMKCLGLDENNPG